jgi:GT2 family glycosyltransferase
VTVRNPLVSIVIPTHNRRKVLERTLASLRAQTYPFERIEVVVVADGCTDGSEELAASEYPCSIQVIVQAAPAGPATSRNRGAAAAHGDLLIFLDDDVEASADMVSGHVHAHWSTGTGCVTIGYLPPALQGRRDFFAVMLRSWWEAMFERMRQPGHRFTYSDLLTGNCSLAPALFWSVGGFDEQLRCHEDFEFGYRLLRAGAQFVFVPHVAGWHDDRTDLARCLQRKRDEGTADVALVRKHPELWPVLWLGVIPRDLSRRERLLRTLAHVAPHAGDALEAICRLHMRLLAGVRARGRWRCMLYELLSYWYWRGVWESLGSMTLAEFQGRVTAGSLATAHDIIDIDLRSGLSGAMQAIDRYAPAAVTLRYGPLVVGTIPVQPWSEPLAGRHLRLLLRTRFAERFAKTLELAHTVDLPSMRPLDESVTPSMDRALGAYQQHHS